ncbi:type IV conjugative transfer system protein TraL [Aliarcobacter skirrowii]|jgi:type IV conjugative transfer system protein TraL|uniref:type IV conjugative transfer system protein TraL n=1 Tax=Aliarcobacter skirrowii TaxID=28200 RepID=UPI0029AA9D4D|nr:type IV conjugative transfer system protein TraL [Aliarcobacter skirrowii]MDX4028401.1 type IV conjugative transfer system protein TraL [Aliarcobacter skirrowii]
MEPRYIPKYLNAEPQILWWDLSEFLKVMAFVAFGVMANHTFVFTVFGIIFLRISGKLTSKKEVGFQKHLAYHLGLYGLKKKVPESWIKELVR